MVSLHYRTPFFVINAMTLDIKRNRTGSFGIRHGFLFALTTQHGGRYSSSSASPVGGYCFDGISAQSGPGAMRLEESEWRAPPPRVCASAYLRVRRDAHLRSSSPRKRAGSVARLSRRTVRLTLRLGLSVRVRSPPVVVSAVRGRTRAVMLLASRLWSATDCAQPTYDMSCERRTKAARFLDLRWVRPPASCHANPILCWILRREWRARPSLSHAPYLPSEQMLIVLHLNSSRVGIRYVHLVRIVLGIVYDKFYVWIC